MISVQNEQGSDQAAEQAAQRGEWSERAVEHPVVSTQEARQGATGQNVRYVLGAGLALIVVAFIVVYVVYFG